MPLWRQSRAADDPVFQSPQQDSALLADTTAGGEKYQLNGDSASAIEPKSVPLRQLVGLVRDAKPELQFTELHVDSAGRVNCSSTPPYSAPAACELLPNAREPCTFENEFVRGQLLFLLNPSAMDGKLPTNAAETLVRTELFEGKNRLFWVQLQLQFKQTPPEGSVLYIGGEVPRAMNLGFFTGRGCNLLLSILRSLVRGLHYSFGESDESKADSEDAELPHISFPLYTAVDQFVRTPAGQEPPELGLADFGESKEEAAQRRRSGASGAAYAFNTQDTYSFHFHSYYLDFLHWQVTNVPGTKATDLRVFWEDMPLHLAAYFVSPAAATDGQEQPATHPRRAKKYQFCFQLKHAPRQGSTEMALSPPLTRPHRLSAVNFDLPVEATDVYSRLEAIQQQITKFDVHVPVWFEYLSCSPTSRERRVGYVVVVREYVDEAHDEEHSPSRRTSRRKHRKTKNERVLLLPALTAFAPLSFLEHQDHSQLGKKTGNSALITASVTVRSRRGKVDTIEGEREFLDYYIRLLATPLVELCAGDESNSRSEHTNSASSDTCSGPPPRPEQLLAAQTALLEMMTSASSPSSLESEWPFLSQSSGSQSSSTFLFSSSSITSAGRGSDVSVPPPPKPGAVHVVRVLGSSQWRHEWLMLDEGSRSLRFSRLLSNSSANKFAIQLDSVLGASIVDPTFRRCPCTCADASPTAGLPNLPLYWLHIGMVGRCHHLAFASPEARRPWMELLYRLTDRTKGGPKVALSVSSDVFRGKHNILSDYGVMQLMPTSASQHSACLLSTGCVLSRPLDLVASALRQALKLRSKSQFAFSRDGSVDPDFVNDLLAFQDQIQQLQHVDLLPLARSEGNRLVFFLNLYHLIVVHASLLELTPTSKTQWGRFFNGTSYRLGLTNRDAVGLVFSLAEVEHCVLRAAMTSLRLPLASLVIPRFGDEHTDPRTLFTLRSADFRINFALNCMTFSCSDRVPVYDRKNLEAQLDEATRQVVARVLRYDDKSRVVFLPKMCDWYRGDFAVAADVDPSASQDVLDRASLGVLLPYATKQHAKMLEYAWRHPYALIQRFEYVPYDFRFRDGLTLDNTPPPPPVSASD